MKILKLFTILSLLCTQAVALEIIYPKTQQVTIDAPTTFLLGNVEPDSELQINNCKIKVYENGTFTSFVKLSKGINKFTLTETKNGDVKQKNLVVTRPSASIPKPNKPFLPLRQSKYIKSEIVQNNTPLREAPDLDSKRITHLHAGVELYIDGTQGGFSRVCLCETSKAWVLSNHIKTIGNSEIISPPKLYKAAINNDSHSKYFIFQLSEKIPYILNENQESNNALDLDLNEVIYNNEIVHLTTVLKLEHALFGYEAYYEDNNLVIKIPNPPVLHNIHPLKHLEIFIDPGHGGDELGAIGLLGDKEKDINLDIALKLKKILKQKGVKVTISREEDIFLSLSDRIELAKKSGAQISISIHANALPDTKNPLEEYGTSVYYYYPQAKSLADAIKKELNSELKTRDDGTRYGSLALTRITKPVSVLVEVAHMINPTDFANLKNEAFRKKAAQAIANGIEKYLKENL